MPYIEPSRRTKFVDRWEPYSGYHGEELVDPPEPGGISLVMTSEDDVKPGDLNYMITELVRYYLDQKGHSYTTYNETVGALECAKLELYRRLVAPYEEEKRNENGDVY